MTDKRPLFLTIVIILNVLFGTMLLMAAAFLVTFSVLGIGDLGDYVQWKESLSIAGAVFGIWSGVWLLRNKKRATELAIVFSVLLLVFEGLLLYESGSPSLRGSLVVVYAIASGGYVVRSKNCAP